MMDPFIEYYIMLKLQHRKAHQCKQRCAKNTVFLRVWGTFSKDLSLIARKHPIARYIKIPS
ncbi:protein of unknown function [Lactobacillus delbrueckii subsp. delbrueckii]|uniref:Uncharacterized protein n=1 Tax=Lactobacillus delbrueckii subsp. delbrueckii TaxID=83684 RepID=A0AAU9QZ15_9LACO|nr:protein of unknown function [Lactobacillus delbrueckii subsp. delbrueckii]